MKIEVTPQEAAAVYVGKAVALLDLACHVLGSTCEGCPMRDNAAVVPCMLRQIKTHLYDI